MEHFLLKIIPSYYLSKDLQHQYLTLWPGPMVVVPRDSSSVDLLHAVYKEIKETFVVQPDRHQG